MKYQKPAVNLMLALLLTHELDAMTQSEWRLLYLLRDLTDAHGRWWFVALHVPLFWALIALTHHAQAKVQRISRVAFAAFCIVHLLLHLRLRADTLSTFNPDIPLGLDWPARRVLSQFGRSRGVNSTAIDDERGGKMAKSRPLGNE